MAMRSGRCGAVCPVGERGFGLGCADAWDQVVQDSADLAEWAGVAEEAP